MIVLARKQRERGQVINYDIDSPSPMSLLSVQTPTLLRGNVPGRLPLVQKSTFVTYLAPSGRHSNSSLKASTHIQV